MLSRIRSIQVQVYRFPTDRPESDGTIEWNETTAIVVQAKAEGVTGVGLTYGAKSAGHLIHDTLAEQVVGVSALDPEWAWNKMVRSVRNIGRPAIASMAISAVDFALWDLKAKILGLPLHRLLGMAKSSVNIYGSGGFTSYAQAELSRQLCGWVEQGIPRVKMKIGRDANQDLLRVREVRREIGVPAELFVDANGAYDAKQALRLARDFAEDGVSWFEEPVSSDDLEGLRFIRGRLPGGMELAAGEYGFDPFYFLHMLTSGAVDVLQADATRCGGVTGFLKATALAEAHHIPLSSHCAPSMHVALGCHSLQVRHLEYFHDHVRIEKILFDGTLSPVEGTLVPAEDRFGFGLVLKERAIEKFAA